MGREHHLVLFTAKWCHSVCAAFHGGCCPFVCGGFIIELAQALWPILEACWVPTLHCLLITCERRSGRIVRACVRVCVLLQVMLQRVHNVCVWTKHNQMFALFSIRSHPVPSSSGYTALPLCLVCVCVCVFDGSGWQQDLYLHSGRGDDCFIIRPCVNQEIFNGCRTSPSIRALWVLRKLLKLPI